MLVDERSIFIEVLNLEFIEIHNVSEVQHLDVHLYFANQCFPVRSIHVDIEAGFFHICAGFCKSGCVVEQLLGDATNIDASATNIPFSSLGRRLDEVGNGDIEAILLAMSGARDTSTASADNEDVIVIAVILADSIKLWSLIDLRSGYGPLQISSDLSLGSFWRLLHLRRGATKF